MALIDKASLLMVPSTYEAGTLYNVLPSGNRAPDSTDQNSGYDQTRADFTFDRGSNAAATRIDENGVLQKYRENKLLQSNQFDTTWSLSGATLTSGQSGYDGSSDAWQLTSPSSGNNLFQANTDGGVQTYSVYAKGDGSTGVRLYAFGDANANVYFNLNDGSVATGSSYIDAKIEPVSGATGWYRCSMTFNQTNNITIRIYTTNNASANAAGTIYIQNAQLESGMVSTDYLDSGATTGKAGVLIDLPRINYDANGENGSLLLEPSRANLVQYSEYFYGSNWTAGATTIVPVISPSLSPEGKLNAYRITRNDSLGQLQLGSLTSVTAGATYTGSFYVKRVSGSTTCEIFNLNNVATSKNITNEWTRIDVTSTAGGTTGRLYIRPAADGDVIDVFGAQLEAGSYVSSYIPNHGTSGGVTRAADTFSKTGISSLINSQEGVFFVEMAALSSNTGTSLLSLSDGSPNNNIYIGFTSTTNLISAVLSSNGSAQAAISTSSYDVKQMNKIAVSYKENEVKLFVNGSLIGTDTSATMPNANTMNEFSSDFGQGSFKLAAELKQAIIFPTALTDSECIALTTL
jgi:hypothetical protein